MAVLHRKIDPDIFFWSYMSMILSYIFLKGIYIGKVVRYLTARKTVPGHFIGHGFLFSGS